MLQRVEYFQNLKRKFKGGKNKYRMKLECGHFMLGDWGVPNTTVLNGDGVEQIYCWHCEKNRETRESKQQRADAAIREWEERRREREQEQARPGSEFPDCD